MPLSALQNAIKERQQTHQEKKRQKDAAKKVSFYEMKYGFVPSNVMSEAEWKDARERAPKVDVGFKPRR